MIPIAPPLCHFCARFQLPVDYESPPTCAAFPHGIPKLILEQFGDHREPIAGDKGVQFELAGRFTQRDLEEWKRACGRRALKQ